MPLDLQLHRVQKLLKLLKNPHYKPQFIHVAGTNGKGSVCSYISHILEEAGIANGRFNSPHLITARDSIQINNNPVSLPVYEKFRNLILETNDRYDVGCTEFELLTCTAFQIFAEFNIPIAIMEVGVGGRLDATNVIPADRTLVVGITKVALDHQNLLGNTLAEIAFQKVGIFKEKVPAIIDGSNETTVIDIAKKEAANVLAPLVIATRKDCWIQPTLLGDYQYDNLAVALKMIDQIKDQKITRESVKKGIEKTVWPGRLQEYNFPIQHLLHETSEPTFPMLLDGAHNTQAAFELGKYLEYIRPENGFVFVIAVTKGKDLSTLFKHIITKNDDIVFTQFHDDIEGMPWIESSPVEFLEKQINDQKIPHATVHTIPNIEDSLKEAFRISRQTAKRVVVCGSLYLVADVLRI